MSNSPINASFRILFSPHPHFTPLLPSAAPPQMYSNTPADFDFKLRSMAPPFPSLPAFAAHLSEAVDIVFPVIHGKFGEDGGIQALLEQHGIPFVGTSSAAARNAFDKASQIPPRLLSPVFPAVCVHLKSPLVSFPRCFLQYACAQHMKHCGFPTLPSFLIQAGVDGNDGDVALADWFTSNGLSPATGSVVGVDDRVVVEVFAAGGKEFTAIVLEAPSPTLPPLPCFLSIAPLCAPTHHSCVDDRVVVEVFAAGGKEFTAIVLEAPSLPLPPLPCFLSSAPCPPGVDDRVVVEVFAAGGKENVDDRVVVELFAAGGKEGVDERVVVEVFAAGGKEFTAIGVDDRVVVEVFAAGGKEFTAIVLESSVAEAAGNGTRGAVCLIPTQSTQKSPGGKGFPAIVLEASAVAVAGAAGETYAPFEAPQKLFLGLRVELTGFAASPATTSAAAAAATEGADSDSDSSGDIFDYRRKYLPTQQVLYSTPPRFPPCILSSLRASATRLFSSLSLRDCARLDGWFLPPSSPAYARVLAGLRASTDNSRGGNKEDNEAANNEDNQQGEEWEEEYKEGIVVFSDVNIVSGMEQTSFLFQQAALVGLSHSLILRWILASACSIYGLPLPLHPAPASPGIEGVREEGGGGEAGETAGRRQLVWVLFGGSTAERQVSLISGTNVVSERQVSLISGTNVWLKLRACLQASLSSGTNVWLKLRACPQFDVQPFLLSPSHDSSSNTARTSSNSGDISGRILLKLSPLLPSLLLITYLFSLSHSLTCNRSSCLPSALVPPVSICSGPSRKHLLWHCAELVGSGAADADKPSSPGGADGVAAGGGGRFGDVDVRVPPRQMSLRDWVAAAKAQGAVVFIAVMSKLIVRRAQQCFPAVMSCLSVFALPCLLPSVTSFLVNPFARLCLRALQSCLVSPFLLFPLFSPLLPLSSSTPSLSARRHRRGQHTAAPRFPPLFPPSPRPLLEHEGMPFISLPPPLFSPSPLNPPPVHGGIGEDSTLQHLLEHEGMPFTFPLSLPSFPPSPPNPPPMHGGIGEDSTLQHLLEHEGMPFIFPFSLPSFPPSPPNPPPMHGGIGEDSTLQHLLEHEGMPFIFPLSLPSFPPSPPNPPPMHGGIGEEDSTLQHLLEHEGMAFIFPLSLPSFPPSPPNPPPSARGHRRGQHTAALVGARGNALHLPTLPSLVSPVPSNQTLPPVHGGIGEDSTLQHLLEHEGMPSIFPLSLPSFPPSPPNPPPSARGHRRGRHIAALAGARGNALH
ncbi:unnamed protein product, partial [Closterium sp. NIES-65]